MRKIPKKNYVILTILAIITLLLAYHIINEYKYKFKSEKVDFVSEIKSNELNEYLSERQETVIYMSSSKNKKNKKIERELKKYTDKNELKEKYLYLDLDLVSSDFFNDFYINYINESYNGSFKIEDPTLVIIVDGKVKNYNNKIKNINDIKEFFKNNGVLDD